MPAAVCFAEKRLQAEFCQLKGIACLLVNYFDGSAVTKPSRKLLNSSVW
jgi:hypothetical protein